ncbi:ATP-binding cassette domain-containing protein [Alsobacter sp. SYSU M60028]|uniref:ATP-binding cassette domain-containing protein n=1 Tax=Alsobacter ponti TaxID=2962936 RepID=A0ABT1LFU9_9HYPH|nr:oligopeptide/dipeptide ABC transporter ATP-binding protein [Alsobacter ponti]MCP8940375.1 ATP-binding cassette domain-containing protein [Alsobacter ponti]
MDAYVHVRGLSKAFPVRRGVGQVLRGEHPVVHAVRDLDFDIAQGETVGLLGESGCGKTTTGRLLLKLVEPTSGTARIGTRELAGLKGAALRDFRRDVQFVFQNPFDALNPRIQIGRSLAEPLINAGVPKAEHADRIRLVLERVRIKGVELLERFPHEMSGGQLQRIVLARALVLEPRFIVADEPVSMLDVSVRAGILNLMRDLQDSLGLTAIYISHDLALVRYVARRTMVMYLGSLVEDGPTEDVISRPLHPYTRALIAAVPLPRVSQTRDPLPLRPGTPDARKVGAGCAFVNRCPVAIAACTAERPPLVTLPGGRRVACHLMPAATQPRPPVTLSPAL